MKKVIDINLKDFVDFPKTDWISGRKYGQDAAKKLEIIKKLKEDNDFKIIIDDQYIKAINDSFIKGFFKDVFDHLKTTSVVEKRFEIQANDYFRKLFRKNFTILEALEP